tara:strand:+ start:126236 stop:126799 length:564 start_codon:yes stop_codon:yes gene_type:complete
MKPIWKPSPNFSKREQEIKYIVLHGTWMDSTQAALDRLCSEEAGVSCHYLIDEEGKLYQLVKDTCVAWHAGISAWKNDVSINQYSLGIELSNPGNGVKYTEAQYKTLTILLKVLLSIHHLDGTAVLAHSDIAPDRKDDPGVAFDWNRLYESGAALPIIEDANPSYVQLKFAGYVGREDVVKAAYALR